MTLPQHRQLRWALAWRVNLWARLLDGNRAYKLLQRQLPAGLAIASAVASDCIDHLQSIGYFAEYAKQNDAGNNPVDFSADYINLGGTWSLDNGLSLGLAYELLGGNASPGGSFRTPLATLHAFQGWADKFLATPDAGVADVFATVKYKAGKWNLTGVYHDFSSDVGSVNYGKELDLSAATKLTENYSILFKGAFFSGDEGGFTDTNKFWIMFTANY